MVFEHLPDAVQITSGAHMGRLVGLLGQSHLDLAGHLEVPGPMFWVFQQNRRYARIIMQHGGALAPALTTRLMVQNDELEDAVGPIRPVFCHNNLSRAVFLNDGQRIWLVDWSHGGWNDGLYDLAGLAIHLELDRVAEDEMLRH